MKSATSLLRITVVLLLLLAVVDEGQGRPGNQLSGNAFSGNPTQPDFGLQIGTSFSTGFSGGLHSTQFLAPTIQWSISPRLHIIAGGIFATGQFSGVSSLNPAGMVSGMTTAVNRPFAATAYAAGAYQVSERLTILGAGWIEHNNMLPLGMRMNPQAVNPMHRGMMVGFQYRITDNLHFGAQVNADVS